MTKLTLLSATLLLLAQSLLAQSFELWGMTKAGGANGFGTIYRYSNDQDSIEAIYSFREAALDGKVTEGSLVRVEGKFFGVTAEGGPFGKGALFEFDPVNGYRVDYEFEDDGEGYTPAGFLTLKDGKLYGITTKGGANDAGTLFMFDPASSTYFKMLDVDPSVHGNAPYAEFTVVGNVLIGMSSPVIFGPKGTLFEWDLDNNTTSKKLDFNNGNTPAGDLVEYNGEFYGTTTYGGDNNTGTVFKWNRSENKFYWLYHFSSVNEKYPVGGAVLSGDILIFSIQFGYETPYGRTFSYKISTDQAWSSHLFLGAKEGSTPVGDLILQNGKIYGAGAYGGVTTPGKGCLYSLGGGFDMIAAFNGPNGANPAGGVTYVDKLLSIEETRNSTGLSVHPNPAREYITLTSKISDTYTITDMSGRTVLSGKIHEGNTTVDISALTSGIYLVYADGSGKASKLIRQ